MYAVVCDPNNATPLTPRCEEICAGPVSLAITKELPLISEVNWDMSNALPLSSNAIAFISFASFISVGPGAVTILYSSPYLLEIFLIRSL